MLRAKIDMASPNINLRDPALYRIKRATHHNTGDRWCIYPMYTYAHPIEDALENITHSICTLEFEDQRPFYDWLLDTLCELGLLAQPRPHQYEFARLNVTYVITSKRKLKQLVDEQIVDGWDDPRMPTIAGLRRRGYTPQSIRTLCERAGTSKAGGWTDYASLDIALRDDLDGQGAAGDGGARPGAPAGSRTGPRSSATRRIARPASRRRIRIGPSSASAVSSSAPRSGSSATTSPRRRPRASFASFPATGCASSTATSSSARAARRTPRATSSPVLAQLVPDTKSGTPGADAVKVKGTITWVGCDDALRAEVRLYDRLFTDAAARRRRQGLQGQPQPAQQARRRAAASSRRSPAPRPTSASSSSDTATSSPTASITDAGRPVFNRIATLRDTWAK